MERRLPWSSCLGLVAALGCNAVEWSPSPVGPLGSDLDDSSTPSLANDLVEMGPDFVRERRPPRTAWSDAAPRVVWLNYHDGSSTPPPGACMGKPGKYTCMFGSSVEDCQRQVQVLLDRWYADFNLIFTFRKPMLAEGTYYDSVITSGGGAYCGQDSAVAGVAPLTCTDAVLDMDGNTPTFYAFLCGKSAHECAVIIAQEHAHLVGLMHTNAPSDILNPVLCKACDGFEDKDNTVDGGMCRSTQNSYQLMKMRLGAWPGGPKEGPFGGGGGGGSGGGAAGAGGAGGAGGSGGGGGGSGGGGTGGGSGAGGSGGSGGAGGGSGGQGGGGQGGHSGSGGSGSKSLGGGCATGGPAARLFPGVVVLGVVVALGRRRRE